MVFCICENLEVMRFSRGFSQMRQQRRASGEPIQSDPSWPVGSAAVALSSVTPPPPPLMSISKTVNLIRFLRSSSDIITFLMMSSLT